VFHGERNEKEVFKVMHSAGKDAAVRLDGACVAIGVGPHGGGPTFMLIFMRRKLGPAKGPSP